MVLYEMQEGRGLREQTAKRHCMMRQINNEPLFRRHSFLRLVAFYCATSCGTTKGDELVRTVLAVKYKHRHALPAPLVHGNTVTGFCLFVHHTGSLAVVSLAHCK